MFIVFTNQFPYNAAQSKIVVRYQKQNFQDNDYLYVYIGEMIIKRYIFLN